MRLCFAAFIPLCALVTLSANAAETFPYTAYIAADDVYVRSGPGRSYYPTSKLQTGDRIEVYRHDPGGWYAIRPVDGSFTWVSGRYLDVGEDGLATVTADRVAARVGSQFSDIRDVIQVRLHRGELVEVLGKKEFGSQPGSGTWYKIAPPSGEFRWVFGRFVDPDYHRSGVREAPLGQSPLVRPGQSAVRQIATTTHGSPPEEKTPERPEQDNQPSVEPSPAMAETAPSWSPPSDQAQDSPDELNTDAATSRSAEASQGGGVRPLPYTNKFVDPAHDPAGEATLRRISPEEFQAELDEIDVELSIMLAEEPTVWQFDELEVRTQALLTEAETALERGRVRLLANKIAQSEDIKRRYDAVNGTHSDTERHNRQLADLGRTRENAASQPDSDSRFDGVGRLARVVPPKLGAPRYALVNEKGELRCYVTPAPGLNMSYYVGRQIGVNGIRGYIADKRAQHVTAKHVTPLDSSLLR